MHITNIILWRFYQIILNEQKESKNVGKSRIWKIHRLRFDYKFHSNLWRLILEFLPWPGIILTCYINPTTTHADILFNFLLSSLRYSRTYYQTNYNKINMYLAVIQ